MKNKYLMLCVPLILTSCTVYRQNFDCAPDQGIIGSSVSDLEQMVVETQTGPDIFLGTNPNQHQIQETQNSNRVWISADKEGGRYLYFPQEGSCWVR